MPTQYLEWLKLSQQKRDVMRKKNAENTVQEKSKKAKRLSFNFGRNPRFVNFLVYFHLSCGRLLLIAYSLKPHNETSVSRGIMFSWVSCFVRARSRVATCTQRNWIVQSTKFCTIYLKSTIYTVFMQLNEQRLWINF